MKNISVHGHTFDLSKPVIMGIINVTPDSFYDGGVNCDPERAMDAGINMIESGAHILDVGGESTRPGSAPVSVEEELQRVIPVVHLLSELGFAVSIDTMKPEVAQIALEAGAMMVNDVSGGVNSPEIYNIVEDFGAMYVAGHMRKTPKDMQQGISFTDVVSEVGDELAHIVKKAGAAGIPLKNIIVDPGIGFGKTALQSARLIGGSRDISSKTGCAVLIGPSNKSFIGKISGAELTDRLPGTISSCIMGWISGANIFRVHDVTAVKQAFLIAQEISTQ
ncbi:MAG: dihydropteroate synthase [Deltaproteobacteria bacterium]|nr:dihydropteroate synthase [Deltaproteobacteria bacterium]